MSALPTLAPRLPGNTVEVAQRPSAKEHSEGEWRNKKELIRKLYLVDNRKLNDIMVIMESQHGFAATYALATLESTVSAGILMS
jgi:hypothetical protein